MSMVNLGFTVWLTGLPCSGKSTLSSQLATLLQQRGHRVEVLDGDVVRENLSRGLGFSRQDRDTNVLRIGFVAKLLSRNGVAVIVAAVSPYAAARREVRAQIDRFVEVHVACPLSECERRDVKGMYSRARAGLIPAFTGVDDPYEVPEHPDVTVHTDGEAPEDSIRQSLSALEERGYSLPATLCPSPLTPSNDAVSHPGTQHREASPSRG
jgi:adenylylsulfate kinase